MATDNPIRLKESHRIYDVSNSPEEVVSRLKEEGFPIFEQGNPTQYVIQSRKGKYVGIGIGAFMRRGRSTQGPYQLTVYGGTEDDSLVKFVDSCLEEGESQ